METTQTNLVTIQIPFGLYTKLRLLAEKHHTDFVEIIEQSLTQTHSLLSVESHRQHVDSILLAMGLCRQESLFLTTDSPLSTTQRDEIAHRVGATGRPLSEIILEERESY